MTGAKREELSSGVSPDVYTPRLPVNLTLGITGVFSGRKINESRVIYKAQPKNLKAILRFTQGWFKIEITKPAKPLLQAQNGGLLNLIAIRVGMHFNKLPKTVDEQIQLLQSRGMEIDDLEQARHYLSHINYYRLAGYWIPFESNHQTHQFKRGTNFNQVISLYDFDRELRLLVLDAIERIEVSFRTQFTYFMAHNHGTHSYLDANLARNKKYWEYNLKRLKDQINQSDELFIKHYQNKYSRPDLPPIWSVCEIMSFGTLSRWFRNLSPMPTRKAISAKYQIDNKVLESIMHHLTSLRNICAHHSRLWNRKFTVTLKSPKKPQELVNNFNLNTSQDQERRIYNTLVLLAWFSGIVSPASSWGKKKADYFTGFISK
jgi:abortive infection bacteriophage resistance protein